MKRETFSGGGDKEVVAEAERLEIKDKAPLILVEVLLGVKVVQQLKQYRNLLLRVSLFLEWVSALSRKSRILQAKGVFDSTGINNECFPFSFAMKTLKHRSIYWVVLNSWLEMYIRRNCCQKFPTS